MSLQKVLYAIKGAAREQRSLADQCIHVPKLKASSLQNAEDMDAAANFVEALHNENAALRDLLRKADEALKQHGGMQYTNTWLARDIAARSAA